MKAVIQNLRDGQLQVAEVPPPALRPGGILVQTAVSVLSAGTERTIVEMARKSMLGKARQRPDLVRQVLDKLQRDGLQATLKSVQTRLDSPMTLGYASAGTVLQVGEDASEFRPADRVACAGGGYANHAEIVYLPKNLAVHLPDSVDFEAGAFTTLGAIALQGIRLAEVKLGEVIVVIGLGLLGQLSVQLLRAAGCLVLGLDIQPQRVKLAEQCGAHRATASAKELADLVALYSQNRGADAVLITASTRSSDPVRLAGEIARMQGRVVAVGEVGMDIPRRPYYDKELTFQVSRSYGPGRYDPAYEEKGRDYPAGYVRWTLNRNMQAFVQQVADARLDLHPLITHRFPIDNAADAYALITAGPSDSSMGVLLTYPNRREKGNALLHQPAPEVIARPGRQEVRIGVLGAGLYATHTLLPELQKAERTALIGVCSAGGVSAANAARKFGFQFACSDSEELITRPDIDTIVIATRHHLHARQVIRALQAGKNVFCEKPLCLREDELEQILAAMHQSRQGTSSAPLLMVGYNRRFAPMARQLRSHFEAIAEPLVLHYRINAGFIPADHWVHDPAQGGGRLIGEVCHFVDLATYLVDSAPEQIFAQGTPNQERYHDDNLVISIRHANGSLASIQYVANGDRSFAKERVEVFGGGRVGVLDNFQRLELIRDSRRQTFRARGGQQKGHAQEWRAFVDAVLAGTAPISFEEIASTSRATFRAAQSLQTGTALTVLG